MSPESLSEKSKDAVASSCGWYDDDGDPVIDYYAVASYGFSATINSVWGADTWEDGYEEVRDGLAFGNFAPGFSLDSPVNRIGTTGWDIIRDAALDVDAFDASLERAKKQAAP